MAHKTFTLDEANRMLPLVQRIVADIQENYRTYTEQRSRSNLRNPAERENLESLAEKVDTLREELETLGCLLKDYEKGLVDWRHERDGRTVFLCWTPGEERVSWWHTPEEGSRGRRPLEEAAPAGSKGPAA
ncbi:MAG: DUF2203 domain-containing protein [Planctomycetota bacterium]